LGALLLGAASLLVGCDGKPHPEASAARPNLLFIAVDTLRADRLGCYGNPRGLTPSIDRLAREGVRFESCFAHAPWTLPSFASLFTSLVPEQHGAGGRAGEFHGLRPGVPTFPERFQSAGYATKAIVNVDFLSPAFGLMRGFDDTDSVFFENNHEMRDARSTTDAAVRWLDQHRHEAFLLFVHYFDPHAEYDPPQPFREQFAAAVDRTSKGFAFGSREQVVLLRNGLAPLDPADVRRAEQLYDGEVAYADHEIGRLLDSLSALGLDENTLVVFTADHGEEFLDHGGWEHGHTLYDEILHVPLILRQKGRIAPRVVPTPVGHIDLAPTLCAWCQVSPAQTFTGRDLNTSLQGGFAAAGHWIAHGNFWGPPLSSVRDAEFQLIVRPPAKGAGERRELYRWTEDPGEHRDLAGTEPEVSARLAAELLRLERECARSGCVPGPRVDLSGSEFERLKGLGYAGREDGK
jgi:arylsulfatase A-like enzyme